MSTFLDVEFRTGPRTAPDPVRAHGAWIFLFAAIGAGSMAGSRGRVEPALIVGTGFVGAFLCRAALAVGLRRKVRQLIVGAAVAILAHFAAHLLGAPSSYLYVAALATVPAVGAVVSSERYGFLSTTALTAGIAALTLAAPAAAVAGGASLIRAAGLYGLLWPFFTWRSLRIAAALKSGERWTVEELKSRGLHEAAAAALWALGSVALLGIL